MVHADLLAPESDLVDWIIVSADEVRATAACHPYSGQLPLAFTVDRHGEVFAVADTGWQGRFLERSYVRPTTPLLDRIAAVVAEHLAPTAQSARFVLHCGFVECSTCRAPLAWLVDPEDAPTAGPTTCPRPDCFCTR